MIIKFIILSILSLNLFAQTTLQNEYFLQSDDINLSHIIPNIQSDKLLFKIFKNRSTKRIKSTELIHILKQYTNEEITSTHRYIQFTKQSPIDKSLIIEAIKKFYKLHYNHILIKKISLEPRIYIEKLPQNYTINIPSKNALKSHGILSIKSADNKQIFFNYSLDAVMDIYTTKYNLKKGEELTNLNTQKKSIIFKQFRAMPIEELENKMFQIKYNFHENKIITLRNVQKLKLVKRGSIINIILSENNIDISFSAEALQDGVYGDIIKARQLNSQTIKVKIIGKNRGKMI